MMALIKNLPIYSTRKLLNCLKNVAIQQVKYYSPIQIKEDPEIDGFLNDKEFLSLKEQFIKSNSQNQNIVVIQPFVRNQMQNTTPQLMLDETVTLAESIPNWKVVHKMTKGLNQLNRYDIFKQGTLENILNEISQHHIDNIVIGIDWLNGSYQLKLENDFKLNVFDRYSMILKIFHQRATTKEAKVQTALAEIPYIRSRLNLFRVKSEHHQSAMIQSIGAGGKDYYNRRKFLLDKRENRLKKELEKIENSRNLINPAKKSNKVPIVGVVGYTNCGKSSLIKHYAKNNSIEPMNKFFATLDLVRFKAKLNNNQEIYFLDTIGFISNIPKNLLQAFNCTLKELLDCDLIVHIYDTNHPDLKNQKKTVYEALFDEIKITEKLRSTMIEVGNKIDLLEKNKVNEYLKDHPEHLFISVTDRVNLQILADRIQTLLEKNLELLQRKLKVKTGSDAYQYIVENSTVKEVTTDKDNPNFSIIDASISKKHYHHLMNNLLKKR